MPVQQVAHGEEVAQGLGHLLALDLQHLVVQPDLGEVAMGVRTAALGDLVLVVREHQVVAAAMDVETLAQQVIGHGRALDVPARTAPAPGRVPPRQVIRRGLPQHKIHRVALVGGHLDPRPGDHVVDRTARQRAVGLVALDREEHVALGLIGVTVPDQPLDHRDHLGDELRRARHVVGLGDPDRAHVLQVPADGLFGALGDQVLEAARVARRLARLRGGVDLVVDVGEVAHVGHVIGPVDMPQQPRQHVEDDGRAGVAEVRAVVDRGPADIHPDIAGIDRREDLLAASLRVGQRDGHGALLRGGRGGSSNFISRLE